MLDDRVGVSPGVRFKDAELIGVPTIVVVGRGLAEVRGRGLWAGAMALLD